ncbi:MAG: VOC family protein [Comamonadaceae bacterium]|nr:MAG: VOC family protein [Comamonadaceae bacterium]
MKVMHYLNFEGRTEEAFSFYEKAIGAKPGAVMRMNQSPEPLPPGMVPPGSENKIMHGEIMVGDTTLMASDGACTGNSAFGGVNLVLNAADDAEAAKFFNALAQDGKVTMPLGKTFFSSSFGTLNDKFGVPWMVIVPMARG